jgi:hypothetical protein
MMQLVCAQAGLLELLSLATSGGVTPADLDWPDADIMDCVLFLLARRLSDPWLG